MDLKISKKPIFVVFLGVFVLSLLISVVILAMQVSQLKKQALGDIPTPTEKKPTPVVKLTDSWQVYANEKYGFLLKYPGNYYLSDALLKVIPEDDYLLNGLFIIKEKNRKVGQPPTIGLDIVQTNKSPKEFLDYDHQRSLTSWEEAEKQQGRKIDKPYIISEENVQNKDVSALKVEKQRMETAPNSKETWYLIKNDGLLYVLSARYGTYNPDAGEDGSDEKEALDLIFSTFKFTQPSENKETIKGRVEGKICYPSSMVPEGYILAKNLNTKKVEKTYFEGVPPKSQNYSLMLVPGEYVFAYELAGSPEGFYTPCALTMHIDDCSTLESHQLTKVKVGAGKTAENIDLCDYYYQPEQKPNF